MWDILGGDHPRRGGRIDAASARSRNVALLINTANVGSQQMGATARGRGMARKLSGHLTRRRGSGLGDFVIQVCGDEQGSQCSQPKWKQQGKDALEDERRQRQR